MIPGIAFTLKKNILIFYTDATLADHPINVFTPGLLGGEVDTNVPLVLAYNRSHYEAMIPETEEDEQRCSRLVELKMSGQYLAEMQNIPLLWNQLPDAVSFLFCILVIYKGVFCKMTFSGKGKETEPASKSKRFVTAGT